MAPLYDEVAVISPRQMRFRELLADLRFDWMEKAACTGNNDRFFPKTRGGTQVAARTKTICRNCPVREECLEYALTLRTKYGIWGGMSYAERREEGKRRGTVKAW